MTEASIYGSVSDFPYSDAALSSANNEYVGAHEHREAAIAMYLPRQILLQATSRSAKSNASYPA